MVRSQPATEGLERVIYLDPQCPGRLDIGLEPEPANVEGPGRPVELGIEAADRAVAAPERRDVVAVTTLRGRNERLEPVLEAEQVAEPIAIPGDVGIPWYSMFCSS